ncbi:Phage-related protein [Jannaschia donghaensis]|uniref:Phage-related protein n=2 Tax=Jannaschia donghaensis TaxID=420998 RepID=A0A0M6YJI4_9RHOB|nr:Phage-related protein [Jannaschia donghaensis]
MFLGDAFDQVRPSPEGARQDTGVQLHKVQQGLEPSDWKPMATVDPGARQVRIHGDGGAFRILYGGHLADAVVVLHACEKKAQKTPTRDLDLANGRLRTFTTMQMKGKK